MGRHSSNTVKNYNIITKIIFGALHIFEFFLIKIFKYLIIFFSRLGSKSLEKRKVELMKKDYNTWGSFIQEKVEENREDPDGIRRNVNNETISLGGFLKEFTEPKPLTEEQLDDIGSFNKKSYLDYLKDSKKDDYSENAKAMIDYISALGKFKIDQIKEGVFQSEGLSFKELTKIKNGKSELTLDSLKKIIE